MLYAKRKRLAALEKAKACDDATTFQIYESERLRALGGFSASASSLYRVPGAPSCRLAAPALETPTCVQVRSSSLLSLDDALYRPSHLHMLSHAFTRP
jgi:hypothetical protein